MSVHLLNEVLLDLPEESKLLSNLTVELLAPSDRPVFDELLATRHYLKNPTAVGQVIRYVVKYGEHWVALLVFSSPAFHLKPREEWLQWNPRQLEERRHLLAQNSRFLILAAPGKWPNLASRILKLVCARLAQDWHKEFGHPVLAVETFVDPNRFRGTCYKAAGWQPLGPTQGHQRNWQDFYTDTKHPKELWVRPLSPEALEQLQAEHLPPTLAEHQRPLPPACPVATEELGSLWECFVRGMQDPRKRRGKRHQLASVLIIVALAVAAGCKGPHAIAEFAEGLNHGQRRLLRCRARPGHPRQFDVPCERTFRRLLKKVDPQALKEQLVQWMKQEDPTAVEVLHLDGKVLKNADPAPAQSKLTDSPVSEIALELQKPRADKALTLVNFITPKQRLVDQIAVPQNTNEEAAVALHLPEMSLVGVCLTADAAHLTKANCRQLTQDSQADYLFTLKANQPHALAKAQQAFTGDFPPSGSLA